MSLGTDRIHVLLVEDSGIHAELISEALRTWNREVRITVTSTLTEARAFLCRVTPDLALLDLHLPDGRGTQLLTPDGEHSSFPAVLLSSDADEHSAVEAMKAGALDYLVKSGAILGDIPYIMERTLREWRHICRRRESEEILRKSEAKYRGLFEHMREAVAINRLIFDPEGAPIDWLVTDVNPAYEEIFSIPRERAVDGRASDLYGGVIDLAPILPIHADVVESGVPRQFELSLSAMDKHLLFSVFPLGDGEYATLTRDLTERRRMELEREIFLNTVIQGYAELLSDILPKEAADGRAVEICGEILRGSRRITRMTEDLLEIARVDGGEFKTEKKVLEVNTFVRQIVARAGGVLETHRLRLQLPDGLPPVPADPDRLERILLNLISNALKFSTPEAPVRLETCRKGDEIEISVIDEGKGIAPEDQTRIFEPFYRAKGERRTDSVGLGLYIARKLVEAHGGRIRLTSAPGQGSVFLFTLPLGSGLAQPGGGAESRGVRVFV